MMKRFKKTVSLLIAAIIILSLSAFSVSAETIKGLTFTTPMDLQKYKSKGITSPWEPHTGWSDDNGILKGDNWIEYCYAVRVPASGGLFYHPEEIGVKCVYDAGVYSVSELDDNGWVEYFRDDGISNNDAKISFKKIEKHNGVEFYRIDYTVNGIKETILYAPSESGEVYSFHYMYKPSSGIAQKYEEDFWDVVNTASLKQKSSSSSAQTPSSDDTYWGGKKTTTSDDMTIVEYLGNDAIKIYVNKVCITPDTNPIIVNDRTLVPIRAIGERLGYSVNWFQDSQTVSMQKGSDLVQLSIGSKSLYHNSTNIIIDVVPMIYESRTYLPVRAVTEAMGCKVDWNSTEKAVYITK